MSEDGTEDAKAKEKVGYEYIPACRNFLKQILYAVISFHLQVVIDLQLQSGAVV